MIRAYCTDTITLKQFKGKDKWGEHVAVTNVTLRAHVDQTQRTVMNQAGQIVVSSGKILVERMMVVTTGFATRAANTISHQDIITVDGVDYPIIKITQARDFRVRHLEVYIA